MKAERIEPKQEFVPVIVTLESQEEVDALYAVIDHTTISSILPVFYGWQSKLEPYRSLEYRKSWKKLDELIKH